MKNPKLTAPPLLLPLALSLCFIYAPRALAQVTEPPNRLDNVVITATRTAQPLDSTLAQAIIITREEIDAAGPASLTELLQRKAGLEIRATGGPGQPSSVFIRGANGAHTLVLIDGLRVGSATSGATALEHIPLELIERVEIVKGSLSGLYGSDAIGGVVQIFTRNAAKPRLTSSAGFGSESARAFNTGFSVTEGKSALTFDAGYRDSKPASATNPAAGPYTYHPDRDPYRNTHALVKLTHTLWQGETVGFTAWQTRAKTDFDSGPDGAAMNKQTLSGYQLTSENNFAANWKSRLIVGRTTDDSVIRSSYPGNFRTEQTQASWFNAFATATGHMSAGIEWRGEKLASDTAYDARKRDTTSIFAGYLEKLGPSQLEFTLRRDEETQFGQRNNGSISYGYTLSTGISAYVRAGRAFRAPSFNDLYYPGFSNPTLKPEQSDQAEGGLRVRAKEGRLDVVHFENRINDLIVFDTTTFLPQNLARARIRGWELQAETSFVGMTVKAALTVQRPEDRDTGRQLRSKARRFGSLSAARNFGKWDASADIVAS
ncbi:MAG: TonB-dependent receptor, partial [Betaproteobacteria bacterium]